MNKLFLGTVLCFLLIACGGSKSSEPSENETTVVNEIESEGIEKEGTKENTTILNEVDADVDSIGNEIDNLVNDLK